LFKIHHQITTFQAFFKALEKFISALSSLLSAKITSIHITATHLSFKFSITGMYAFLEKGNFHIFSIDSSSILTTIILSETFRLSPIKLLYNLSDKFLSILTK